MIANALTPKSGGSSRPRDDHPFIHWFGRLGYAAKATVYSVMGVLALTEALNLGVSASGSSGALRTLHRQPFGDILLLMLAGGLLFYMFWRFAQGLLDVEHKGSEPLDLVKRAGLVISGALYGLLAWEGLVLARNAASSGKEGSQQAAQAMSYPGGDWLIVGVGIGFGVAGLYQLLRAWKASFNDHWEAGLNGDTLRWATRISRFGIAATALIFVLMATYITQAGLTSRPERVQTLGDILTSFAGRPWLLGASALGILCYATYTWTNAVYRRIPAR